MLPPLPEDEYKVVYRPRTGLKLSTWSDKSLTQGIATAGGFPFKDFYSNVTIQTQWAQNLIIASTADEDYAMKLSMITQIQLGAALYELMPYLKPLPGAYCETLPGRAPRERKEGGRGGKGGEKNNAIGWPSHVVRPALRALLSCVQPPSPRYRRGADALPSWSTPRPSRKSALVQC